MTECPSAVNGVCEQNMKKVVPFCLTDDHTLCFLNRQAPLAVSVRNELKLKMADEILKEFRKPPGQYRFIAEIVKKYDMLIYDGEDLS